ncbi:MAG: hypothetical protein OEZ40_01635 [Candidatus Bathyarchaeota archaeon]|nr:hypothetical protein [Candidatus Bathyarchaeota archaeon]
MATFGKTDIGGSWRDCGWTGCKACRFTTPEAGTITKLTVHSKLGTDGHELRGVICANGGDNKPAALLASGSNITDDATESWKDLPISYVMSSGVVLHLGWQTEGGQWAAYAAGASDQFNGVGAAWNGAPNPFSSSLSADEEISIYATYTPSDGANIPAIMRHYRNLRTAITKPRPTLTLPKFTPLTARV